jgi:hypothetical protein
MTLQGALVTVPAMMIPRNAALAITVLTAALALTACSTPAPSTPSPASSSPAPSGTPSASASSDPNALVVSTDGLGPLKMGQQVPAGNGLVTWKPDLCGAGAGGWQTTGPDFGMRGGDAETDPVAGFQIADPEIVTPSGVHVGSTHAEVAAALPDAAYQVTSVYGTDDVGWYSVVAGGNRLTLSVTTGDGAKVVDSTPVKVIFLLPASADDRPYIGTGGVGASCPT